jgi:2-methylcitrate dehydratase PrpD
VSDRVTALEQLGTFVAGLRAERLPASVREKVKLHVADTIGAWVAGMGTAEGRALLRFREELRTRDTAASLLDDVATNCAVTRLSEIDDIHLAAMITAGSIVVPGALTIACSLQSDPGDLAVAIAAGYETMIRLGLAIDGPTVLYRGIWPTYFAAPCGIAAVAARLMKLDAGQTAHALALALTLASPGVGHHNAKTTSRWFAAGNAARNGLTAALAARSGFTSDVNMTGGFLANVYGLKPDVSRLTEGLGDDFALTHVSFKPWCAARQTMAATQALKELIDAGLQLDKIETIEAHVLPPHLKMIDHGVVAGDRASFLTSVQYHLAMAALMPDAPASVGLPDGPPEAVRALMTRITVTGDDALLADYPKVWPARVVVKTRKGTHELTVTHVPGDTARPFREKDIERKFGCYVAPAVQGNAKELFRRSLSILEGSESPTDLLAELGELR